jgi:hypothetical protein
MRGIVFVLCLGWLVVSSASRSWAQGCSDAGFCTIGSLNQEHADTVIVARKLTWLLPVGLGDDDVLIFTPGIQYDQTLNQHWSWQTKLTANYAHGELGSVWGVGDWYLSATYEQPLRHPWNTSLTVGAKVPLGSADRRADGASLPMTYQSTLGSVDAIVGLSFSNQTWQFAAGWQQPLSGRNNNSFVSDASTESYPSSQRFSRRGDVLLRATYGFPVTPRLSLRPGLLAVYHLGHDTFRDDSDETQTLRGSEGLTLNSTLLATWKFNKLQISLAAGVPWIVRDVRPDGLTRSWVISPEIAWTF